jgi:plasmid stability protein
MTQLTVRGFDKELARRLRETAKRHGVSLNRAALLLLRRGAGLDEPAMQANVVGDALDDLAGRWSEGEAREFQAAIGVFEEVDRELWP